MSSSNRRISKLREFVAHNGEVQCVRIGRKSGQIMASGGDDHLLNIWHMGNPDPIMSLEGHSSPVTCLGFDPAEELIIAGSERGSLKLWDLEKQKVVRSFNTGHLSSITCVDFHPFGDYFVSGSIDTNARVWDIRKKSCLQVYKGHSAPVLSCRFTPDGKWLVTGDELGVVKLWDLTQGKQLQDFTQHSGAITCLDFHPSEFLLATGSKDKTVKFWDLDQFQLISSTVIDTGGIRALTFTEEGDALLSGSSDNLKTWSWEPNCTCHDIADTRWNGLADMHVNHSLNQVFAVSHEKNSVGVWVMALDRLNPWKLSRDDIHHQQHIGESPSTPVQRPQQPLPRPQQQLSQQEPQQQLQRVINSDVKAPDFRTEDVMTELNNSFNQKGKDTQATSTVPKTIHVSVEQLETRHPSPPEKKEEKEDGNTKLSTPVPPPKDESGGILSAVNGTIVPANRDKPLNIDPAIFHPSKYEKDVMVLTDAEIMQELMETHAHMVSVINSRLNNIKIVRRLWSAGQNKEAVDNIVKINDPAIAIDFLKQIIKPENVRLLTLDMCVALLPLQPGLLSSKFEDYILASLNTVNLLYKSFSPLIQTTIQSSHHSAVGVDLNKEERIEKCRFCYQRFLELRSLVDKRFSLRSDAPGDVARQLLTTMGRPAHVTARTKPFGRR